MAGNFNPIFRRNIERLGEFQPELAQTMPDIAIPPHLETAIAASGDPVLVKKGISFHSRRDPQAEAKQFARSEAVRTIKAENRFPVVFGLGSGYHIQALCDNFDSLVVIETDPAVLRLSFETLDWTAYFSRVTFLTKPSQITARIQAHGALLSHRPSQRSAPMDYARFLTTFGGNNRNEAHFSPDEALKFLVVSPVWGGSLPITFHAVKALQSLGHTVRCLDLSVIEPLYMDIQQTDPARPGHDLAAGRLVQFAGDYVTLMAESEKPDFLLALAQAPLNRQALARIRSLGVRTAFWFVEDYRFMQYFREIAASYDFFFHIQGPAMEKELAALDVEHFSYLPLAADPEIFRPADNPETLVPYRADLSFMGSGYPNRRFVFSELLDHDLKIWGTEWDLESNLGQRVQDQGRRIPTEETVFIYNAARINLNLHSSVFETGLDREGAFINPRTFEIASCAAFQLVDQRDPLRLHFEPEVELAEFFDINDLREKIAFYLDRPDLRKEMGLRARDRILAEHTYQHRMKAMIEFILARV